MSSVQYALDTLYTNCAHSVHCTHTHTYTHTLTSKEESDGLDIWMMHKNASFKYNAYWTKKKLNP